MCSRGGAGWGVWPLRGKIAGFPRARERRGRVSPRRAVRDANQRRSPEHRSVRRRAANRDARADPEARHPRERGGSRGTLGVGLGPRNVHGLPAFGGNDGGGLPAASGHLVLRSALGGSPPATAAVVAARVRPHRRHAGSHPRHGLQPGWGRLRPFYAHARPAPAAAPGPRADRAGVVAFGAGPGDPIAAPTPAAWSVFTDRPLRGSGSRPAACRARCRPSPARPATRRTRTHLG